MQKGGSLRSSNSTGGHGKNSGNYRGGRKNRKQGSGDGVGKRGGDSSHIGSH